MSPERLTSEQMERYQAHLQPLIQALAMDCST